MTTHRFFVPPEWVGQNEVVLTGAVVHQIRNVLRMRPGEGITVLDNSGWEYQVELTAVEQERVTGRIIRKALATGEPRTKVALYQGVLRGRHFEWVLQKGTELGIVEFVPVICDRCLMSSLEDISATKITRWQRIILEAAEQSGRGRLPRLQSPMLFPQACGKAREEGLALMLWEGEQAVSLRERLGRGALSSTGRRPFSIGLYIGPEGGFSEEEVNLAKGYGIRTASLGPRTLKAETAGLIAASAILYEFGDLG